MKACSLLESTRAKGERIDPVGMTKDVVFRHSPDLGPNDVEAQDTAYPSKPESEGGDSPTCKPLWPEGEDTVCP